MDSIKQSSSYRYYNDFATTLLGKIHLAKRCRRTGSLSTKGSIIFMNMPIVLAANVCL